MTLLLSLVLISTHASAGESAQASMAASSPMSGPLLTPISPGAATIAIKRESTSGKNQGGLSFYYLTSRTTRSMSYQDMKSLSGGGDGGGSKGSDGGGGGPGAALPNLNYVSAAAFMPLSERDTLSLIGMQSVDSADQLKIATPFGADFQLPSQVGILRYQYRLSPEWSASVRGFYIDTVGFRDPSAGATYTRLAPGGWMQRYSMSASAPITASSQSDDLITRASVRASFTKHAGRWALVAGLMHMHSFFDGGQPPERRARGSSAGGDGRATQSDGKPIVPIYPSDVDLILIQREMQRTRTDLSLAYDVSDHFTIGTSAGLSYAITDKERTLWMTSAKPLILKYVVDQAEIGTDVSLNSDIRDFSSPRLPSIVSIGLRVGYTFGQKAMPY
jgi:hypothetical protein